MFAKAATLVAQSDVKDYVGVRSKSYQRELSATSVQMEHGIDTAMAWHEVLASDTKPLRFISLFTRAARRVLLPSGREMILRVCRDEPGREILRWRFLSLAFPPGIMIAAATKLGSAPPDSVRLLNPSMAPDYPVAQNHVHHAAMMSFEELWASLHIRAVMHPGELFTSVLELRAFCPELHPTSCAWGRSETERLRLENYCESPMLLARRARHMAEWADLVRQACIARSLLDRHSHHRGLIQECTGPGCAKVLHTTLRAFVTGDIRHRGEIGSPYPWPDDISNMARRLLMPSASAAGRYGRERAEFLRERVTMEQRVLQSVFSYLRPDEAQSPDAEYEKLFLQYLRVKTAVFGSLTHSPGEHGLKNFQEHFSQIKVYAPEADILKPRVPYEPGLRVMGTEYRVSTESWLKILEARDPHIEGHRRKSGKQPESAWLIHFKRDGADKSLPLHGSAIRKMEGQADLIERALHSDPTRLRQLRGIDVCGVEEVQPCWVSAPTLRRVRLRSRVIAARRPQLRLEPLRLTIHAGEDFRWLTSGVRAIAEPFVWGLIERGDRIGHGIAITLDPDKWWQRRRGQTIETTRLDRLLDLAFLAVYARDRTAEQTEWLRTGIERVVNELRFDGFENEKPILANSAIDVATNFWLELGRDLTRRLSRRPEWNPSDADSDESPHKRWIHNYLWSRSIQVRASVPIGIKVDSENRELSKGENGHEIDMLIKARECLIRELCRWQVCIESNPSSNFLVGALDGIVSQDFLQQRPTTDGQETLTWTISTDDPITFSTSLADEYAYAWAGMVLRKDRSYGAAYARALLDEAAMTSVRMRFSIPSNERINRKTRPGRDGADPD
jgi:hypothetical protein